MINTPSTTAPLAFFKDHAQEIQGQLNDLLQHSNTSYALLPAEERQQLSERLTTALGEGLARQRPVAVQQLLSTQTGDHQIADMLVALDLVRKSAVGALKRLAASDPAAAAELFELLSDALSQLSSASTTGLLHETVAEAQHQRRLNQLIRELHEVRSFEEFIATIVRHVEPTGATGTYAYMLENDEQGQPLWCVERASWTRYPSPNPATERIYLPEFPLAPLLFRPNALYIGNVQTESEIDDTARSMLGSVGIKALFDAPIVLDSRVIGALTVNWGEPREFSPQERDILDTIVFHAPFLAQRLQMINELKTRVEELTQLRGSLETQADELRQFKMLIDNALDGIVVMDPELRLIYTNRSFLEMTGLDETAVGQVLRGSFSPSEQQRITEEVLPEVLRDGDWQGTATMVRTDGADWTASISAYLISDEQGATRGISWFFRDISEQLRDEQERLKLQEEIILIQQAALRELSTPIIPLTEDVLVMPLIGSIDSNRAQQIIEGLLDGVTTYHASTAILDITGVPVVDTQIANALLRAASAVKLLGARMIITGIRPEVAQTLVGLGVGMGEIITYGTLQTGIASVLSKKAEGRSRK
ncbi:MAG: hypothetical protein OHK0022_54760 [Roseiflexaceae bacterium]